MDWSLLDSVNNVYSRLLLRRRRIDKLLELNAPEVVIQYERRKLQEEGDAAEARRTRNHRSRHFPQNYMESHGWFLEKATTWKFPRFCFQCNLLIPVGHDHFGWTCMKDGPRETTAYVCRPDDMEIDPPMTVRRYCCEHCADARIVTRRHARIALCLSLEN